MNIRRAVSISLVFVMCLGIVGQAFAQSRGPGVNPGDYFTYTIITHWSSDNSSATIPDSLIQYNNTLSYKFMVESVSDSNVTATDVWRFVNGTEQDFLVIQNVDSGTAYYMSAFQSVVGANLNVNDLLHPSGSDFLKVNQTIPRSYSSGNRDTNVVMTTQTETTNSSSATENITYYFDKTTGMLVELQDNTDYTNPNESGSIIWVLSGTNRWTVSGSSSPLPLPILLVIIVVIVVVLLVVALVVRGRRGRKKKSRR